jgi:pyruvate/2-oxoglutarate dehydrogenase complex dihydrolipoamide acyltransferase (E2) component
MAIVEVLVPQLGEGLQEVRVIRFLKQAGDRVARDEHIYEMETDKANVEVESPYEGVIVEWLAKEGDILPIGAPIARMEVEGAVAVAPPPYMLHRSPPLSRAHPLPHSRLLSANA